MASALLERVTKFVLAAVLVVYVLSKDIPLESCLVYCVVFPC